MVGYTYKAHIKVSREKNYESDRMDKIRIPGWVTA